MMSDNLYPLIRSSSVLLAGHPILCAELRRLLAPEPKFLVHEDEPTDSSALLRSLNRDRPDLVVLDLTTHSLWSLQSHIRTTGYRPAIVAVAPRYYPQLDVAETLRPLVKGVLLRRMALTHFTRPLLRGITRHYQYVIPTPPLRNAPDLTRYEYEVLLLMTLGFDVEGISTETGRGSQSVYSAQTKVRRKLAANSNSEAMLKAIQLSWAGMLVRTGPVRPTERSSTRTTQEVLR